MSAIRIVVDDVDAAIAAFETAGFAVVERWGPPFAILSGGGDTGFWIAGPGTSAATLTAHLPGDSQAAARVRPVHQVDNVDVSATELSAAGWVRAAGPLAGPGGNQLLLVRAGAYLELFAD